jgi:hypothetical protein
MKSLAREATVRTFYIFRIVRMCTDLTAKVGMPPVAESNSASSAQTNDL